jgi:hypothetical protein
MKPEMVQAVAASLRNGTIRIGGAMIDFDTPREAMMEQLARLRTGPHQEWAGPGATWRRYLLEADILWYARQPVSFAFEGERLALVSLSDSQAEGSNWDYKIEVRNYMASRQRLVDLLGAPDTSEEADTTALSVSWVFPRLSFSLTCDQKNGRSALWLRRRAGR